MSGDDQVSDDFKKRLVEYAKRALVLAERAEDEAATWVWVCPVFTDCLPLSHGASSQSNLFVL